MTLFLLAHQTVPQCLCHSSPQIAAVKTHLSLQKYGFWTCHLPGCHVYLHQYWSKRICMTNRYIYIPHNPFIPMEFLHVSFITLFLVLYFFFMLFFPLYNYYYHNSMSFCLHSNLYYIYHPFGSALVMRTCKLQTFELWPFGHS